MAKALQCPSCGTKRRIDTLTGSDTFECEGCGQVTKVPPGLQDDHRAAAASVRSKPAPTTAAVSSSEGAAPEPPRRRSGSRQATAAPTPAAAEAAVGAPGGADPGGGVAVAAPPVRGVARGRGDAIGVGSPDQGAQPVKIYWRVLAWLVALPIALAAVGIPARRAGYLNSQRLLNVIVDSNATRFVPILVIIVLWALMTALLVTALVAVGQRLAARRRARRRT